jgi:hypothetical protein
MGSIRLRFRNVPTAVLGVTSLLCLGGPLHARITAAPNRAAQTEDASRREIDNFNRFLESHQEVAVQLHSTPWLVDNPEYLRDHPELRSYLQDHPGVRQSISDNPAAFMKEDAQRSELAQFSRFLDAHPDIAEQLRRDPKLADDNNFMQAHPDLKTYLDEHQTAKVALHENATTFMQEEEGYNRNAGGRDMNARSDNRGLDADDRERDANRRNLADFQRFLDSHREIAEQIRKDPSLADSREFVENHPALQTYLQNNPGVRDDLRRDPNAFMREEDRFDHASNGYRDPMHDHMADFGGFLGDHRDIARDLSQRPDAVKDREFVENRPDLNDYLNAHPDVRDDLMANPQDFVKGAQKMSGTNGSGVSGSGSGNGSGETPAPAPKGKQ